MIRTTRDTDIQAIVGILERSGQFDAEGVAYVRDVLEQHLSGAGDGFWLTADDGAPVGVAYCAPEAVANGTWNLLLLWTREDRHRTGLGSALVAGVEAELRSRAARLLIVETSGLPAFAPARAFYAKSGFAHEATIRNFYAVGDDKLVFTKSVADNPT